MSDVDVDQSIVEKIRKLLAKAEGGTTPEEAEALFAKATALMQKHAIDEAMLEAAGEQEQDKIDSIRVNFGSTYWQAWRTGYANLSRAFGFQMILMDNGKNGWGVMYGWRSELKVAEVMFASLQIQVARSVNAFMKTYSSPMGVSGAAAVREDRFKARRSYIEAFVGTVASRIAQQRAATRFQVSKEKGQSDGSLLPAILSKDELFRDWIQENVLAGTKSVKLRSGQVHGAGWGAGRDAGQKADIGNNGVGGSRGALGR